MRGYPAIVPVAARGSTGLYVRRDSRDPVGSLLSWKSPSQAFWCELRDALSLLAVQPSQRRPPQGTALTASPWQPARPLYSESPRDDWTHVVAAQGGALAGCCLLSVQTNVLFQARAVRKQRV